MWSRSWAKIVLIALVLAALGMFLVAGALDPPSRLKTRPATATDVIRR